MDFGYPTKFREDACRRMLADEAVEELAVEFDIAASASYESDELARARRRIHELEAELAAVKAASALFNNEAVIRPKSSARSFET